jgi:S1-C subfamily serine protease
MSDSASNTISATPPSAPLRPPGLWEPLVAVILAAAWFGFLMWPGVVLFPPGASRPSNDGTIVIPPANTPAIPQATAPTVPVPVASPPVSQNPGARTEAPPATGQTASRLQPGALAEIIDNSVVIIAGTDAAGQKLSGTGFFVTPTLIVTNRHVVDKMDLASLKVASKRLQPSQQPRLVAKSPDGQTSQVRDLALLSVDQPSRGFLKLGPSAPRLAQILSVAYPDVLQDLNAPSVISTGTVNEKDDTPPAILKHSAMVGRGGAGGPLVDLCGRVVGVNTGADAAAIIAQDVRELQAFLGANNATATVDSAVCPADAPPATTAGR